MKFNRKNFKSKARDRFILSKGHGCLAYYSALSNLNFFPKRELLTFEKDDSFLKGHPVKNLNKGIEFSNGSLGMGLSLGIGLAIAGKKSKINYNVYVLMGDGECNEGSVWEALMSAPKYKLDNLYVIIDRNNFQQTGSGEEIMNLKNLSAKLIAFNWEVDELDGHNINALDNYFSRINNNNNKPKILIANTIKGKGFSFSENNNNWHHAIMTKKYYEEALKELNS